VVVDPRRSLEAWPASPCALEEPRRINVGVGSVAPPVTCAVDGKQYIAIAWGIGPVAKAKLTRPQEMKNQPNATMLFVFRL
jgi:alcohol dehydrogenase (cytochrome c)